jgi:hypothetical protein
MLGANLLETLFVFSFNHQNPQLGLIALTRREELSVQFIEKREGEEGAPGVLHGHHQWRP